MIETIITPISLAILTSGVIFYMLGNYHGYKKSAKLMARVTIDMLVDEGYVRFRTLDNGEIEILKLNED